MEEWRKRIRCYVSPAGNNKIAEWYADLSAQEKADADEFIKDMGKTQDWKMPNYRPSLKGYSGLGELRWQSEGKQHRLIGYRKGGVFFALIGCTHKQQIYNPSDALNTADKRKKETIEGKVTTVDYGL
jgi:hypothetical protein